MSATVEARSAAPLPPEPHPHARFQLSAQLASARLRPLSYPAYLAPRQSRVWPKLEATDDDFGASVAWTSHPAQPTDGATQVSDAHPQDSYSAYATTRGGAADAQGYAHAGGRTAGDTGNDWAGHDDAAAGAAHGGADAAANHARNQGVWDVHVRDSKVELEGTSDTFVSYLVTAQVHPP